MLTSSESMAIQKWQHELGPYSGVHLKEYCENGRIECPDFNALLKRVRRAAPEIITHKGYTSFAIASCVTRICISILRDEHTVLPVSTMMRGQYGIDNVYLSLPSVIGRGGVEHVIELSLDDSERAGLLRSAEVLRKTIEDLRRLSA